MNRFERGAQIVRNTVFPRPNQMSPGEIWAEKKHLEGKIFLVTPEQFNALPDGTELTDVYGTKLVKGQDNIPQDTKGGHLACGFRAEEIPAGMEFTADAEYSE